MCVYNIFFYVVVFVFIIDFDCLEGVVIFIEEWGVDELGINVIGLDDCLVCNFVFDVMLVLLIVGIIIEYGVFLLW